MDDQRGGGELGACVLFVEVAGTGQCGDFIARGEGAQGQWRQSADINGLKVPCAPKSLSSSFSYSTCTNDFGAVTHNERRFQFRLGIRHIACSEFFRVSWVNR